MDPLTEMRAIALRHTTSSERLHDTPVPRLHLYRADDPSIPTPSFYEPMFCIVVAGRKRGFVGTESVHYQTGDVLLVTVEMPIVSQILEASPDSPYLALGIALHRPTLASVMLDCEERDMEADEAEDAFRVTRATPEILDAALRLVRLIERPRDIGVVAPLIERELLFRLLVGPAGGLLREITRSNSRASQVVRAVSWLRQNFDQEYKADVLARAVGVSTSTLNRHFRAMTAMSPLEYQKSLRLQEARRLMLASDSSAGEVGYQVGYTSPSQFTREYRRMFGVPPGRDAEQMRATLHPSG